MRALMLTAAPPYAALLGLLFLVLCGRVMYLRRQHGVMFGAAGDEDFERVIRAQANFAEYVPLALILLVILEVIGAPKLLVHLLGIVLVLGRVLHAGGVAGQRHIVPLRFAGIVLTLLSLLGLSLAVFFYWLGLAAISG
ncbi:MAPEG family protein [Rhodoligotrophos defluvii]|uniref:MAPEG family protein n=1 Tax=Rhodoligotrophos defluvii TaxID=2561934 RepID=UPI00195F32AC|nr:MAPEG family protein [Rhodoligotrophos defluvii]